MSIDLQWDSWFWESYELVRDDRGRLVQPKLEDRDDIKWLCGNPRCGLINLGGHAAAEHQCAAPQPIVFVVKLIEKAA